MKRSCRCNEIAACGGLTIILKLMETIKRLSVNEKRRAALMNQERTMMTKDNRKIRRDWKCRTKGNYS